jgi:hypothetical protein
VSVVGEIMKVFVVVDVSNVGVIVAFQLMWLHYMEMEV